MTFHRAYIGDGIHAEFSGYVLRLFETRVDGYIALDFSEWLSLVEFMEKATRPTAGEDTE